MYFIRVVFSEFTAKTTSEYLPNRSLFFPVKDMIYLPLPGLFTNFNIFGDLPEVL